MTSALRPLLRIAWRDVRRNRRTSFLVVALIAVPVAAACGGLALLRTVDATPEERAANRMGQADLFVGSLGAASSDDLADALPPASRVEPVDRGAAELVVDGRSELVAVDRVDLDGLGAGMRELRAGRLPAADDEVALSRSLLRRTGLGIGDRVALDGRDVAVVGEVRDPERLASEFVLQAPAAGDPARTWLVAVPGDPVAASRSLDEGGQFWVRTRADTGERAEGQTAAIVVLGSLGLVEAALVAAAAFAVSTRRRQRELGLLAATGAHPGHLRAAVVLSGVLLGLAGSALGTALGIAGIAAVSPRLESWADRALSGVVVPAAPTIVLLVLGVATATVAAAVPARAASRLPVRTALAGRRPPAAPGYRNLGIGAVLVAGGAALVLSVVPLSAALGIAAGAMSMVVVVGSVASVLGFGLMSPWLLEQLGRLAPRLTVGPRLAVRDTARFRTRNGPVVTAVLAGLALSVSVATGLASVEQDDRASYEPMLREDQLLIAGRAAETVAEVVAQRADVVAVAPLADPVPAARPATGLVHVAGPDSPEGLATVLGDADVLQALGADAAAIEALEGGKVVVLGDDAAAPREVQVWVEDDTRREEARLPTHVVAVEGGWRSPKAVVAAETLASHGIDVVSPEGPSWIARFDGVVPSAAFADAVALADATGTTVARETGYQSSLPQIGRLVLGLAVATGLLVLAVALALAAAETRNDQRTLLAVGADPRLRRSIAAGRAAVLAGLGAVLAVPAGLLPVIGVLRSSSDMAIVIPWGTLAAVTLLTPALAIAAAWSFTGSASRWTAFRDPT